MKKIKLIFLFTGKYLLNLLIAIDQLGNSLMAGSPDETISSRAGRRWPDTRWARFIDGLFFWQSAKRHVIAAIENSYASRDDLLDELEHNKL